MTDIHFDKTLGDNLNAGTLLLPKKDDITNQMSWSPGNRALLKSGESWVEKVIYGASGTTGNYIEILSYSAGLAPIIDGGGVDNCISTWGVDYIKISDVDLINGTENLVIKSSNIEVNNVKSSGAANSGVTINGGSSNSNITFDNLTSINNGGDGVRLRLSAASVTIDSLSIVNCTLSNNVQSGLRATVETAGVATSTFTNLVVDNSAANDNGAVGIWVRNYIHSIGPPAIWGTASITNNTANNNGTISSTSGGIVLTATDGGLISGNTVDNNYCQGGSIQTAANKNLICSYNTVTNSKGAMGIDGVCIFCDNYNDSCSFYGNWLDGPDITLPVSNSGSCFSLWNCANNLMFGNFMLNGKSGVSFGNAVEVNNRVYNNLIYNMSVAGIFQHGTNAVPVNCIVPINNMIVNCDYGVIVDTNQTSWSNNLIYNSTTADYSGQTTKTNDVLGDPKFRDAGSDDFSLLVDSAAIGAATYLADVVDRLGFDYLSNDPDIGPNKYVDLTISDIVTGGFGTWGSLTHIITRGFDLGIAVDQTSAPFSRTLAICKDDRVLSIRRQNRIESIKKQNRVNPDVR